MSAGRGVPGVAPVRVSEAGKVYAERGQEPVIALVGVTLEIRAGEIVALTGPSGSGKSTLLNLIGCIDLPTSGSVAIDGSVTSSLRDDALTALRRERVGTVFQFFNLLPALTVEENVALPLVLAGCRRMEIDRRVAEMLEAVGMAQKRRAFPPQLSGGQAQRAAVARAIVHKPAIVLADEPTGNLDSQNGADVLQLLRALAGSGHATLVATHSVETAAICDRTLRMLDGRVVG